MGLTFTRSPKSVAPLMGLPLGDDCGPILLMGLTLTPSSTESAAPLMGLTSTQRRLWTHSDDGSHPHSESKVRCSGDGSYRHSETTADPLCMGLAPTQSPAEFAVPLIGLTPLGDDYGPTPLMDLTPIWSPKSVAPLMGLIPTRRRLQTHSADGSHLTRSLKSR